MPLILASEFSESFSKTQKLLGTNLNEKKITIIPTASYGEGWDPNPETNIIPFEKLGMKITLFDIKEKSSEEVYKQVISSDIIYVCGGNTFYLLKYMQDCGFKNALIQFLENDGIYIGSSAGSIVLSPDISFISIMDDPNIEGLDNHIGLGLIDFSFLPHLDHSELAQDAKRIIEEYKDKKQTIFALSDSEALYVDSNIVKLI